ncbi:MAG: hypothetical protein JST00_02265 [Deltaproteobacteria bacterium]|nr:hypothetical protein [Deltaproteobacteria bacterium]
MTTRPLEIHRAEFLRWTALLALASCEPAKADAPLVQAPILPPVQAPSAPPFLVGDPPSRAPAAASASARAIAPPEPEDDPSDPRSDPSCNNANGSLAVCSAIGPACEGLSDECMGLGDLRPRVAQKFGECFAKARRPSCRDKAMGACMRAAVMATCIEPGSAAECRRIMRSCRAAGKTPTYTLEECAKVVSAPMPSQDPSGWPKVDAERLGPTGEDGCTLRQVLPYQPWGPSWDGTFDRPRRGSRP